MCIGSHIATQPIIRSPSEKRVLIRLSSKVESSLIARRHKKRKIRAIIRFILP
jgi:hypothetical protein